MSEREPFEIANNITIATACQTLCKTYEQCTFFVHNQENSSCEMFDTNIQSYKDSCRILSMTPDVDIAKCYNSTEASLADPCLVSAF